MRVAFLVLVAFAAFTAAHDPWVAISSNPIDPENEAVVSYVKTASDAAVPTAERIATLAPPAALTPAPTPTPTPLAAAIAVAAGADASAVDALRVHVLHAGAPTLSGVHDILSDSVSADASSHPIHALASQAEALKAFNPAVHPVDISRLSSHYDDFPSITHVSVAIPVALPPPAPLEFNNTKATPGPHCPDQSGCEACNNVHFCAWNTVTSACVLRGFPEENDMIRNRTLLTSCRTTDANGVETIVPRPHQQTSQAVLHRPARFHLHRMLLPYRFSPGSLSLGNKVPLEQTGASQAELQPSITHMLE